jgi:hypothetical protein
MSTCFNTLIVPLSPLEALHICEARCELCGEVAETIEVLSEEEKFYWCNNHAPRA